MLAMLGGSIANILLDYVFIFPLGMGIFGAVLATGLAPLISIAIMSCHWMKKNKGFHLAKTAIQGRMALLILSLGFPSLITEAVSYTHLYKKWYLHRLTVRLHTGHIPDWKPSWFLLI